MEDRDELQGLWQSQPVIYTGDVPRFGLIDDLTAPVYFPMSRAMRWSTAAAFFFIAAMNFLDLRRGLSGLELASAWAVEVFLVVAIFVLLLPLRSGRQAPPADASIVEYRSAIAREFIRQSTVERRLYLPIYILIWVSYSVRVTLEHARDGLVWYEWLVPISFLLPFAGAIWQTRQVRERALRRILSGL